MPYDVSEYLSENWLYGEPIKKSSDEALAMGKQIIAWQVAGHSMYPIDIINMMVENGILQEYEIKQLIREFKENPEAPKLPKTFLTE